MAYIPARKPAKKHANTGRVAGGYIWGTHAMLWVLTGAIGRDIGISHHHLTISPGIMCLSLSAGYSPTSSVQ